MRIPYIIAAATSIALFFLYAIGAARDLMFGDGPELTLAAVGNGLAGPPGYPLWIMLAHLASLVPFGQIAYRVNLTSCVYHALTIGVVFLSGCVLTRQKMPALFAASMLALTSPLFVSWSLQAEVFPLNDLFAATIVLLCMLLLENPNLRWGICALGLVFGLGLANHHTIVLLAPLAIWVLICQRRTWLRSGTFLKTLAVSIIIFVAAATLPYVHTLVVSQHLSEWTLGQARTPQELVDVFERKVYGTFNLAPLVDQRGGSTLDRVWAMLEADGWPALLISIGCLGFAIRKRFRQLGIALLIVVFPFLLFCAIASIDVSGDLPRATLQRFGLLWLTAAAPFASGIFIFFDFIKSGSLRSFFRGTAVLSCLVFGAFLFPRLSLAQTQGPRVLADDIDHGLPRNAVLETCGDATNGTLIYYRAIEKWRPDVTVILHGYLTLSEYRATLKKDLDLPDILNADLPIQTSRDIIADSALRAKRAFWVAGDLPIHTAGPRYYAAIDGVISRVLPLAEVMSIANRYRNEVALESVPGFAEIPADRWQSNGFGSVVRSYYAGGFFTTGYDAERLGDSKAAQYWYRIAQQYSDNPIIQERLNALQK